MKKIGYSQFLIGGIRVPVDAGEEDIVKAAKGKMKREGVSTSSLHFRLFKKSVDARRRDEIRFECTVLAEAENGGIHLSEGQIKRLGIRALEEESVTPVIGQAVMSAPPLVVGMGPAGLFAALLLAQNGYAPILIDRGGSVEERAEAVAAFRAAGRLDPECNIQFGAGGAGTFSDGKLITRIHDPKCAFVLKTLADFGAPRDILVQAKPHVGTDLLRIVVSNLLCEIERLGGRVIYHCCMKDFERLSDGTLRVKTNQGELVCGAMIMAIGHSSRDTYESLIQKGFAMEQKPISVGVRTEHLQSWLDFALYGDFAGHPNLGHAEYSLSDTRGGRGVYTFCMCPGGEVVAAASEEGGLVVNGMSYHARSNPNANAAVAVSVYPSDIEPLNGNPLLGSIAFQRSIERAAYRAGGGDYYAPIMTMGDFLSGKRGSEPTTVLPSYRDGKVRISDFESIFPTFVLEGLRRGFDNFGKKIKGYDAPEAVLTAAETRTSAPLRILRDPETLQAVGENLVYPCGEGAGYAGGITSAGVDGVRCALALMARFAPTLRN